ncbi:MAG TPA: DUF2807 domain-containing protein [Bacteroidales bacterium]|nr:DUF2807 domain-containing protein [Bacteroidales bacterium]
MKLLHLSIIILCLSCLSGCKKEDACGCFVSTGPTTKITKNLNDFNTIELSQNINLTIIQDTLCSIEITGGKNVLKGIRAYIENNILYIKNINKCNWTRSFDRKINAKLRIKKLNHIIYRGTGIIVSENAIITDSLRLDNWEGAGDIKLEVIANTTMLNMHTGTSNLEVVGFTKENLVYTFSYGKIDCKGLFSPYVYITNRGTNDCFVYAGIHLIANIKYIGNIYYAGNPNIIETNINGTGKVIPLY